MDTLAFKNPQVVTRRIWTMMINISRNEYYFTACCSVSRKLQTSSVMLTNILSLKLMIIILCYGCQLCTLLILLDYLLSSEVICFTVLQFLQGVYNFIHFVIMIFHNWVDFSVFVIVKVSSSLRFQERDLKFSREGIYLGWSRRNTFIRDSWKETK